MNEQQPGSEPERARAASDHGASTDGVAQDASRERDGSAQDRPRLGPRPIETPPVDPHQAAVFGRPTGVTSAFAPRSWPAPANGQHPLGPPSTALATAFRRPIGADDIVLQRPPGPSGDPAANTEAAYWTGGEGRSPWRDPGAGVVVGAPAKTGADEQDKDTEAAKPIGPLLSVPELLFGRRVKPSALVILVVCALLVGAVGGVTGWALGTGGSSLTDVGDTLTQTSAATERAPGSVAAITAKVAPAVVSLEVQAGSNGDVGSGVVIDPKGYIITNNHVIASAAGGAGTITAVFSSGARVPASIVGRDPITDLAVLKVNASDLTVIRLGTSSSLRPGDPVIAIGSPLGLAGTVTSGIVSALNRPVLIPGENGGPSVVYDAIQTDAAINPGNSGGALVDATGALVGINSANQTYGSANSGGGAGGSIGLGFAIPIDQATKIAQSLIRTGTVKHAVLGVSTRDVSATASLGAQVDNVVAGGAAAAAGIANGDVITKFGGRAISSSVELQVAVLDDSPGQTVSVQFARNGQQHTVRVTLGSD